MVSQHRSQTPCRARCGYEPLRATHGTTPTTRGGSPRGPPHVAPSSTPLGAQCSPCGRRRGRLRTGGLLPCSGWSDGRGAWTVHGATVAGRARCGRAMLHPCSSPSTRTVVRGGRVSRRRTALSNPCGRNAWERGKHAQTEHREGLHQHRGDVPNRTGRRNGNIGNGQLSSPVAVLPHRRAHQQHRRQYRVSDELHAHGEIALTSAGGSFYYFLQPRAESSSRAARSPAPRVPFEYEMRSVINDSGSLTWSRLITCNSSWVNRAWYERKPAPGV